MWATRDGRITVESVTLSLTPEPSRFGDPDGDGEYLLVRTAGMKLAYVRSVAGVAGYVDLADLFEVARIDRCHAGRLPVQGPRYRDSGRPR